LSGKGLPGTNTQAYWPVHKFISYKKVIFNTVPDSFRLTMAGRNYINNNCSLLPPRTKGYECKIIYDITLKRNSE
jgi:hypothetical protein